MRLTKKRASLLLGLGTLGVFGLFFGKPACLIINAWLHDANNRGPTPPGFVDDASGLNRAHITEVVDVAADPAGAEEQIRGLLERARTTKLGVSIAGAKHSMGGHTICPEGIMLNMLPFKRMELDPEKKVLRVGAGARWAEVVPYLDSYGFSPLVMQSNNNFSIGGSLSVNCHGWQVNCPPIASTVLSLRAMKADGNVVRCSREENAELFGLLLGGYGLFGVILEAELRVTPNERYRAEAELVPTAEYGARCKATVNAETPMGYGRLCVVPGQAFLKESLLTRFRVSPCKAEEIPALGSLGCTTLHREVFRAQIGSTGGKELRWKLEQNLGETARSQFSSRNQLFNWPAEIYQDQSAEYTDILHEYFVPTGRLEEFLSAIRLIIPRHKVDLLNVTVRHLLEDRDTALPYADQEMFALVMLFNHPRNAEADLVMEVFTRDMIDTALSCGGRYYLPYRLHATVNQFQRAYPRSAEFFAKKVLFDPDGLFKNQFYLKYGIR